MTVVAVADKAIEGFIARWQGLEGGRERANYQLFLIELAEALGVERPAPSDSRRRDYAFERCLFTMFAEEVRLLLEAARTNKARFRHELAQLWQAMDRGGYEGIR